MGDKSAFVGGMKLGELCLLFTDGDWIESKDQSDSGIRLIQTGNIGNGEFLYKNDKAKYISEDTFKRLNCTEVFPDDILISRLPEPVGRGCIIPDIGERMITAVDCTICRVNAKLIDRKYFCYFLESNTYKTQLEQHVTGTTRKRISRKNLSSVEIDIPEQAKQKEIVYKLDRVKKIIQNYNRELDLLDEAVRARFVEMFGDPVINDKEWEIRRFSDLGELKRGKSKHRPRNDPILLGGKYPLIQTGDVTNSNTYIKSYMSTYSEKGLKQSKMWRAGTLCITIAANIAESAILTFDACFPDSVVGFTPNGKVISLFVHYWLSFLQPILEENAPAVAQKNLNVATLEKVGVIVPPLELQNQFASFVEEVDKSRSRIQKSLEASQELFDSLMQEYFG